MKKKQRRNSTEQFVRLLGRANIETFMALCKILDIQVGNGAETKEEFDMRPFEEVWAELIEKFHKLGRPQRRELLKLMRQVSE